MKATDTKTAERKTFEEILKPMRFPNEEYGSFDVCYNDCLTAFKTYQAQFKAERPSVTDEGKCDTCGRHPSVLIRTQFGRYCQEHARYI